MYDVIIIGAGIAGQTASIYAARKRMNYLLLTKNLGGQFLESGEVLNYPGIIETMGVDFEMIMEKQLKFNKVKPKTGEEVIKIEKLNDKFKVITDKNNYPSKSLIIATGARPGRLNVPGEEKFAKKGITYCAICDGPLFSGMDIAIIGGGNSALEAVDFTKDIANKIYLINNKNKFTAYKYLVEKVKSYKNVEVITYANTTEIFGDNFVTGLEYERKGKTNTLDVRGVIIEIGRVPNTEFLRNFVETDEHNHIVIDCQGKTSVDGVFAAGDCASGHEYQYVISAGQGCMALLKVAAYLASVK